MIMQPPITDHIASPGPLYWDYRCTVCSEAVDDHAGLLWHLWHRIAHTSRPSQ